jgi:NTP pyrophosphatase (non-canonical NTP hydrolase)
MDMNEYQLQAKATDQYAPETRLIALIAGLASEAGEVAGKLSKHLRGDLAYRNKESLYASIHNELGDVLWYVAMIADCVGTDLNTIASLNVVKLKDRYERNQIKGDGDDR